MLRGRIATAVWDVGSACLIAALASGVFAHPVQLIAGENGYVVKANQAGQELAAELATGDSEGKTAEQLRKAQTGQLVDTFVRQPTQMINFGQVLDGTKCESAYTDVVRGGPYGNDDAIRDRMDDCADALGDYAKEPSASMAMAAIVIEPSAFVILLLALVLAGSVISAGCWAMFQSLKLVVTLVTGLLPGGGRGSLLLAVSETVVSLLIIIFTSVFLGVFLLVIQALFKGEAGSALARTFVIFDVMIVVGIVVYLRQRKRLAAASQRMAAWLGKRPGGSPATRLPDRQSLDLGRRASSAVRTGLAVAQWRAQRKAADGYTDNRQQTLIVVGGMRRTPPPPPPKVVDGEVVPGGGGPGDGRPRLPQRPDPSRSTPGASRPAAPPRSWHPTIRRRCLGPNRRSGQKGQARDPCPRRQRPCPRRGLSSSELRHRRRLHRRVSGAGGECSPPRSGYRAAGHNRHEQPPAAAHLRAHCPPQPLLARPGPSRPLSRLKKG